MTSIEDMINNISNQEYTKAETQFADIMQDKINDALEQEKVAIAQAMWSPEEEEEEYIENDEDMEISDEEMEDAMDELENDDEY
jgi:hypothetical protein